MISVKKSQKEDKKIQTELPYFITLVTLLASSGLAPYNIFKKIREIDLLPTIREESDKMIKKIDNLGMDPLVVMTQQKEKNTSKSLGEFFSGYVAAIQGGGDVINYLKSRMNSVFESYENAQREVVGKARALVEAYMTTQIVILAIYIIMTATATTTSTTGGPSLGFEPIYLIIILPPLSTAIFLAMAHKTSDHKANEVDWKKAVAFGIAPVLISILLIFMGVFIQYRPYIFGAALIAASMWPFLKFQKIYLFLVDAENATPRILREIAETRKAGLGPEKCISMACKRKDYGKFNRVANAISNKLEWGIPLENIYAAIQKEIKNFQILISFRILFEIISGGGGNVNTLQTLASISEKIQNIEKSKTEMLRPYVLVGFILVGITGFTTLLVIDTLTNINMQSQTNEQSRASAEAESKSRFELLTFTIIIQAWLAGLLLGRLITNSYSGGFKYSIMLLVISMLVIVVVQLPHLDMQNLFKS